MSSSLSDDPSEIGHAPFSPPHPHSSGGGSSTKMLVSHGTPQNVRGFEKSHHKKSRPKPHPPTALPPPIATDTGVVATETKPQQPKVSDKVKGRDKGSKSSGVRKVQSAKSILVGDSDVRAPKPRKERCRYSSALSSSDEDSEVDVTTPLEDTATSLSVSLRKSLIQLDTGDTFSGVSGVKRKRDVRAGESALDVLGFKSSSQHGAGTIASQKPLLDTSDTARHHQPPLVVSINKDTLLPTHHHHKRSKSKKHGLLSQALPPAIDVPKPKRRKEALSPQAPPSSKSWRAGSPQAPPTVDEAPPTGHESYRVEFDGCSTKMIFRTSGGCGSEGGAREEAVKKKKHKKKKSSKLGDSCDKGGGGGGRGQGESGQGQVPDQGPDGTSQDTTGRSQDTTGVWFTEHEPLKVKIKFGNTVS